MTSPHKRTAETPEAQRTQKRTMMDAPRSMRLRDAIWNPPLRTLRLRSEIAFSQRTHRTHSCWSNPQSFRHIPGALERCVSPHHLGARASRPHIQQFSLRLNLLERPQLLSCPHAATEMPCRSVREDIRHRPSSGETPLMRAKALPECAEAPAGLACLLSLPYCRRDLG